MPMKPVVGVSSVSPKGQVTLPADIRRALGINAGDKVIMTLEPDGVVYLRRLKAVDEVFGSLHISADVQLSDWKAVEAMIADEIADELSRSMNREKRPLG